jgi:hypothetical protein
MKTAHSLGLAARALGEQIDIFRASTVSGRTSQDNASGLSN